MGITFTEFLLGKDVRSRKTGRMVRIEQVNSVNDIIGRPLFKTHGSSMPVRNVSKNYIHKLCCPVCAYHAGQPSRILY